MSNQTNNAQASFFGIGGTIQVHVDVNALSLNDRLAMLHHLMHSTGTTAAICSMPNSEAILTAIQDAWLKAK